MLIGKLLPDFTGHAVLSTGAVDFEFNFEKYRNNRAAVILFYAMDFSYVCPTELLALSARANELNRRDVAVVAISTDSHMSHLEWRRQSIEDGGIGKFPWPMFADGNRVISREFGVLVNDAVSVRSTVIADRKGYIRFQHFYDFPFARNFDETIRCLDMLAHHEKTAHMCPVGWQIGHRGLLPSRSDAIQYVTDNLNRL